MSFHDFPNIFEKSGKFLMHIGTRSQSYVQAYCGHLLRRDDAAAARRGPRHLRGWHAARFSDALVLIARVEREPGFESAQSWEQDEVDRTIL